MLFGFMVGAFVLIHNHNFFSSRFQYQELRICLNVCLQLFPRRSDVLPSSIYMMLLRHLSVFVLFGAHNTDDTRLACLTVIAIR